MIVRSLVCLLVNAHDLSQRIPLQGFSIEQTLPAVNHHPKLCAPVADVIDAHHVMHQKLRDPRERVAEHSAADVTDMHRFGYVGRTKINHNTPWRSCLGNAESII